jgi:hypothetical protein
MATLELLDIPDDLYQRLVERSEREHRTVAEEAVLVLSKGLTEETNRERRARILDEIHARPELRNLELSDPVKLIREDRDR